MFKLKMRLFTMVIIVLYTLQAFPVCATAVTQNSFAIRYEDVYMFSIYRHYKGLYAEYDNMAFIKAINALPLLQKASELSEEKLTAVYSTYCGDERTHVYQIRSNELRCDDTAYALTLQQYNALKQAIDQTVPDSKSVYYPIWLGYINPARVASMTFTDTDGITKDIIKGNLTMAAQAPMHITVSPNNASTYLKKDIDIKNLKDSYQTVIRFDNNSFYIFVIQGNKLYVESSGRDYGYVYEDTNNTIYENATAWQAYIKSMKVFVSEQVNPAT